MCSIFRAIRSRLLYFRMRLCGRNIHLWRRTGWVEYTSSAIYIEHRCSCCGIYRVKTFHHFG